jgi:hypothetical protein
MDMLVGIHVTSLWVAMWFPLYLIIELSVDKLDWMGVMMSLWGWACMSFSILELRYVEG